VTEPQEPRGAAPAHLTSEELSEYAFSPEAAAEGPLEHLEGCADCAAELADLRVVLTELAALPEPELPESVAIRLDAAVARAWLDVDAEQEAEREAAASAAAAKAGRGRRLSWRKIAIPLGSLSLVALAAVGIGVALDHSSSGISASSSSGVSAEKAPQSSQMLTNPTVLTWVRSILPSGASASAAHEHASPLGDGANCSVVSVPQRSGYTVLTTSQREFENQPATLVVYQSAQEPASPTVLAVVYAGSCATSSASDVLAEGSVSR
jgi:hypothetical protein